MKDSEKGIALFDSGIGGLTVLNALQKQLPNEKYYYLADTLHLPYGNKSAAHIQDLSLKNATFLMSFPLKALVIACNTASALAYQMLLKRFNVPLFDVITPAVNKALEVTQNKTIAVLGTESTIHSHAYEIGLKKRDQKVVVYSLACPLLVPLIEENLIQRSITQKILKHYLSALKGSSIDTLILGCTHYPFLKNLIQKELDKKVHIVDSALELSRSLSSYFVENKLISSSKTPQSAEFYVSGSKRVFQQKTKQLLGQKLLQIKSYKN